MVAETGQQEGAQLVAQSFHVRLPKMKAKQEEREIWGIQRERFCAALKKWAAEGDIRAPRTLRVQNVGLWPLRRFDSSDSISSCFHKSAKVGPRQIAPVVRSEGIVTNSAAFFGGRLGLGRNVALD